MSRVGSYARMTASRSGSKVTLKTSAKRFWGDGEQLIGWASGRGLIQYRTPGTSTWKSLKEVYSTSSGTYSYPYTTSSTRYYRVLMRDVSTIWGATSPEVYRSRPVAPGVHRRPVRAFRSDPVTTQVWRRGVLMLV